jgi:hypothetical protein
VTERLLQQDPAGEVSCGTWCIWKSIQFHLFLQVSSTEPTTTWEGFLFKACCAQSLLHPLGQCDNACHCTVLHFRDGGCCCKWRFQSCHCCVGSHAVHARHAHQLSQPSSRLRQDLNYGDSLVLCTHRTQAFEHHLRISYVQAASLGAVRSTFEPALGLPSEPSMCKVELRRNKATGLLDGHLLQGFPTSVLEASIPGWSPAAVSQYVANCANLANADEILLLQPLSPASSIRANPAVAPPSSTSSAKPPPKPFPSRKASTPIHCCRFPCFLASFVHCCSSLPSSPSAFNVHRSPLWLLPFCPHYCLSRCSPRTSFSHRTAATSIMASPVDQRAEPSSLTLGLQLSWCVPCCEPSHVHFLSNSSVC